MCTQHPAKVIRFEAEVSNETMSLKEAIQKLSTGAAAAVVLDVVPRHELEAWWEDEGFSSAPFIRTAHHSGIVATGVTLGQLQRERGEKLVAKAAEYFSVAGRVNDGLRRTRFVRLFVDALGAKPLTLETEYPVEFLSATRRVYLPIDAAYNFAPHCDDVSYSRDSENWPQRKSYPRQLGAFLAIQGSGNDAGMVMWDIQPSSRAKLDAIHDSYRDTGEIPGLDASARFVLKPQPGQLTLFQSKNLHAIERCTSERRTLGLFLIEQDDGWRFFN